VEQMWRPDGRCVGQLAGRWPLPLRPGNHRSVRLMTWQGRWDRQEGREMAATVLLVEDERKLRELVRSYLERAGFTVLSTSSGAEAISLATSASPDLVVLDLGLPDISGETVASELRATGPTPILMLTAMDHAEAEIEGLSEGADDYLGKPFDLEVLAARARALLRRNEARAPRELKSGTLRLDPSKRRVWRGSEELNLTAREFTILELLMAAPGAVVSREDILEHAWGEREEPMSNTIDVLVGRLRRKLDASGKGSTIETVRGMGYRLR